MNPLTDAADDLVEGGRPLRILHLTHSLDPLKGGSTEALRQLGRGLKALGDEQTVVTLDAPGAAWLNDFPLPVHALGPARWAYGLTPRLRPWLRRHGGGYDAWLVHGLWQYHGLAARAEAVALQQRYFVFAHGMLDPWFRYRYPLKHLKKRLYWRWGEYRVLRDAQGVLFTADEEARLAAQSFAAYRANAVTVRLGLAPQQDGPPDPDAFMQRHPALRGRRIVLFMARLHPKKGGDLLLRAFAALAGANPLLHLVMAGPEVDGHGGTLKRLALQLGIGERVLWTGALHGAIKWSALSAAEVFVLPSHQENFGMVVVEALTAGTPVLLSERVNIWREIIDAGAGLAATDTLAGITDLLQRWLALGDQQRLLMRQRARACADECFDLRRAAQRLHAVLTPSH